MSLHCLVHWIQRVRACGSQWLWPWSSQMLSQQLIQVPTQNIRSTALDASASDTRHASCQDSTSFTSLFFLLIESETILFQDIGNTEEIPPHTELAIFVYIHSTSDGHGVTHIWQHRGIFPQPKPDSEIAPGWDPTGGNRPGCGGRRGGQWRLAEQLTSPWLFMSSLCLDSELLAGEFKGRKLWLSLPRGFNGDKDQEPEYSLGPASWHHQLPFSKEPESEAKCTAS